MHTPKIRHTKHRTFARAQRSHRLKTWLVSQATRLTQTAEQIFDLMPPLTAKKVEGLVATVIPVNIEPPHIFGYIIEGQTLNANVGEWELADSYTYAWNRSGTPISGATASSYTLVTADVGTNIKCVVTASNENGSAAANSQTIGSIQPITTPVSDAYLVRGQ